MRRLVYDVYNIMNEYVCTVHTLKEAKALTDNKTTYYKENLIDTNKPIDKRTLKRWEIEKELHKVE